MADAISTAVHSFLKERIRSVLQLELLLKIREYPAVTWSVTDIAKQLYTAASATEFLLEDLRVNGLVARLDGIDIRYQYSPRSEELRKTVDIISELYHQRRVTIVTLIYSTPVKNIQDFADAFRIRKRGKD